MQRISLACLLCLLAGAASAGPPPILGTAQRVGPLVTGDGAIGDQLGRALAHDGNTLVVGARQAVLPAATTSDGIKSGAAYVYTDSGTAFVAGQRIEPPDPAEGDLFGLALALAGDVLVVGAPSADRGGVIDRGAAYVFRRSAGNWSWEATLAGADPVAGDNFGSAVAYAQGTILVGAPGHGGSAAEAGAVFAFRQVAGNWTLVETLASPQAAAGDRFGSALAMEGDRLLVGVPLADAAGAVVNAGAVDVFAFGPTFGFVTRLAETLPTANAQFGGALYLGSSDAFIGAPGNLATTQGFVRAYARSAGGLLAAERLVALDGASADGFGFSLDFDGSTLLVGAPARLIGEGGGYVFTRVGGVLTERARLEDLSPPEGGGLTGIAAALVGARALLGADLAIALPNRAQGIVRVWQGSGANWTPQARIDRGDGAAGEFFGFTLAIDGPRLAVGSFLDDTATGGDDAGTVSLFDRSDAGWQRAAVLQAPDGAPEDWFGRAVGLSGNLLVVGAPRDIVGADIDARGSAYVFRRDAAGQWLFERKLVIADGLPDDAFGFAIALDGRRLLVTAPGRDDGGTNRGCAYAWTVLGDGSLRFDGQLVPASVSEDALAGISIALAGDRVVLGAPEATVAEHAGQGAVVTFDWNAVAWVEGPTIISDGIANDGFGGSVALESDGSRVAVGASGVSGGPMQGSLGAAYVFRFEGARAVKEARLQAAVPEAGAGLGSAIDLRGGRLLVGASGENAGGIANSGRVHAWQRSGTDWQLLGTLQPADAGPFAFFGRSIASTPGSVVVGGPLRASLNPAEGSAWIYPDLDVIGADGFE